MTDLTPELLDELERLVGAWPNQTTIRQIWKAAPALIAAARELASLKAEHRATLELANNMVAERQAQLADARAALEIYAGPGPLGAPARAALARLAKGDGKPANAG